MIDLDRLVATVPGWMNGSELRELHRRAAAVSQRRAAVIVEIGSWYGRSTIALASACAAVGRGRVTAIDPYRQRDDRLADFEKNMAEAGVAHYIRQVRLHSHDARAEFTDPVDLVFIDGAHDLAGVTQDIDDWVPLVHSGGTVAFNDPSLPGVHRALRRALTVGSIYRQPRLVGNTLFLTVDREEPWSMTDTEELRRLRRVLALRRLVGSRRLHRHLPTRLSRWGSRVFERLASPRVRNGFASGS